MKSVYLPIIDGWSIALLNSIVSRLSHSLQNCGNHDYQRFMKILGKKPKELNILEPSADAIKGNTHNKNGNISDNTVFL